MTKTYTLIILIFILFSITSGAQTITTVAGGGAGDGGDPLNALISPYHMTVHNGAIYFGDIGRGSVRKLGTDGTIHTVVGCGRETFNLNEVLLGGQATATALGYPAAVAFDSKENMYFVDAGLNCVFKVDPSGIITRIAGIDTNSYNGDNIPATNAALNDPLGIAIDNADNIYIADHDNNRIRKINTAGIITTVAGNGLAQYVDSLVGDNGPATMAQVPGPMDVCIDKTGNIIGCSDNILFKVNSAGIISRIPFINISSTGQFNSLAIDTGGQIFVNFTKSFSYSVTYKIGLTGTAILIAGKDSATYIDGNSATSVNMLASGITLDDSGHVYLCGQYGFIRKINDAGKIHTIAGDQNSICDGATADNAVLQTPTCVTFDASGCMYIFENTGPKRIRKVRKDGVISTLVTGEFAFGLCADNAGNLYAAQGARVKKITPAGIVSTYAGSDSVGFSGDNGPATAARISVARDIVMDKGGNMYLTDPNNHRVRKVSADGIITTIAGGGTNTGSSINGGAATAARLTPVSIALSPQGDVLITDSGMIRKIGKDNGIITTIAGPGVYGTPGDGGPATAAYLYCSINNRMTVDTSGNIFFTTIDHNVRMIDANGIITTIAGKDTAGFKGDGGAAIDAKLNRPTGICLDDSGRIYIADQNNNRVRRINRKYTYPPPVDVDPDIALHVFPNPATTALQIKYNTGTPGDVHLQVFDAVGKKAIDLTIPSATGAINETIQFPPALPPGMYILKITTPSTSKTAQFIIAR